MGVGELVEFQLSLQLTQSERHHSTSRAIRDEVYCDPIRLSGLPEHVSCSVSPWK